MGRMASQITSLTIAYSTVYSSADQRKHQSSASLAFVRGIHRWPVNSPHKWTVTRKMFPFDDVIMGYPHYSDARVYVDPWDPFYLNDLTLISKWINNYITLPKTTIDGKSTFVAIGWMELVIPFPNFNGAVKVREWISNFIPQFIGGVISYPCWD